MTFLPARAGADGLELALRRSRRSRRSRRPAGRVALSVTLAFCLCMVGAVLAVVPANADNTMISYDPLRTGWDSNEPHLGPSDVTAADFGQLFATQLDGQVYAQPVVAKSVVMAVTENNKAYGLDRVNGAIKWTRDVGKPWKAGYIGCGDLVPNIGITGTPVVDEATGTAYFTAKVDDGPDGDHPHWYVHAVDITTGAERAGFPVTIAGSPTNDPGTTFNAKTAMQRPGLLLLGGVVYAAFASHCDHGPYVGYVIGFDAATGQQTTMWATQTDSSTYGSVESCRKDVRLENLNLINSPSWTMHPYGCERVVIDGVYIHTSLSPGVWADGIDRTAVRTCGSPTAPSTPATTRSCFYSMNWYGPALPCENITVTNCRLLIASSAIKFCDGNMAAVRNGWSITASLTARTAASPSWSSTAGWWRTSSSRTCASRPYATIGSGGATVTRSISTWCSGTRLTRRWTQPPARCRARCAT